MEEYATGARSPLWLCRQVPSTTRRHRRVRDERGDTAMLSNIWRDVRYALRTFRRSPGFAVAAMAPIALGIGINTGLFSILNSAALRPLPVPDSTELVSITSGSRAFASGGFTARAACSRCPSTAPTVMEHRRSRGSWPIRGRGRSRWARTPGGDRGGPGQLQLLRRAAAASLGRAGLHVRQLRRFRGAADRDPEPRSLDARVRRRPRIAGKTITLNGRSVGVAGVAPPASLASTSRRRRSSRRRRCAPSCGPTNTFTRTRPAGCRSPAAATAGRRPPPSPRSWP